MNSSAIALREIMLELCVQYHDHRIRQMCWNTTVPPYNASADKDRVLSIVQGIQNYMHDLAKEQQDSSNKLRKVAHGKSLAAVQHNLIITLCQVKETNMSLQQILTSLISLLYKRRLDVDEDITQLIDFDVTEDSVWLLFNITVLMTGLSTTQHLKIAYALLRNMSLWLTNEIIDSDRVPSSSSAWSIVSKESLIFLQLRVLLNLVHLDLRIRENNRYWHQSTIQQYEAEHLDSFQQILETSNIFFKSQSPSNGTLWQLLIQHYSLCLELVKLKRLIGDFQLNNNGIKLSQMLAVDAIVTNISDQFKSVLTSIHGVTVTVEVTEEIHCNMLTALHDLIADFQLQSKHAQQKSVDNLSSVTISVKLSGSKMFVKLNLLKVQVLILKKNYAEAQSLLQSLLSNCDNEHDQAAILNNITLFRPWSGPDGLADLTYHKALSYQFDHHRIFGRIQCPPVDMSRIAYNIALTQMKASRFCEAYYLLAMLSFTNEHEFARNPLYLLRLGECCIHHDSITSHRSTSPRYYVRSFASPKRKYYALICEQQKVNPSNADLEKQLEEIAQPFQISPCKIQSARKYLSIAFFFAESSKLGIDVARRIGENLMFVCARLQDPSGVQLYGRILQQKGLNNSEFYVNTMAKSYYDQGRILQCVSELQARLGNASTAPIVVQNDSCIHALNRNYVMSKENLKISDSSLFVKLTLLTNSLLASSQSLNSNQIMKFDEILKMHPNFVPAWSMKFLQAVENKNIDVLNGHISSYYKHSG